MRDTARTTECEPRLEPPDILFGERGRGKLQAVIGRAHRSWRMVVAVLVPAGLAAGCDSASTAGPTTTTTTEATVPNTTTRATPALPTPPTTDAAVVELDVRDIGMETVLADVSRDDGIRLVVGNAKPDWGEDLMLVALSEVNGRQLPLLINRSMSSFGSDFCHAEVAEELVPGGESIVAGCRSGGSNGLSYVVVIGVDPNGEGPKVMLEVSCAGTRFDIEGATLRLTSEGEKAGIGFPGPTQPDQLLTWDRSDLDAADFDSFYTYCDTGDDRYNGPDR